MKNRTKIGLGVAAVIAITTAAIFSGGLFQGSGYKLSKQFSAITKPQAVSKKKVLTMSAPRSPLVLRRNPVRAGARPAGSAARNNPAPAVDNAPASASPADAPPSATVQPKITVNIGNNNAATNSMIASFTTEGEAFGVQLVSLWVDDSASLVTLTDTTTGQQIGEAVLAQANANGRKLARFYGDAAPLLTVGVNETKSLTFNVASRTNAPYNGTIALYMNSADAESDIQVVHINAQNQTHDAADEAHTGGALYIVNWAFGQGSEVTLSRNNPFAVSPGPEVSVSNAHLSVQPGVEIQFPLAGVPVSESNIPLTNIVFSSNESTIKVTKLTAKVIMDEDSISRGYRTPLEQLTIYEGDRPLTTANGVGFRAAVNDAGVAVFSASGQGATELFTLSPNTSKVITIRGTPHRDTTPGTKAVIGLIINTDNESAELEMQADGQTFSDREYLTHIQFNYIDARYPLGEHYFGGNRIEFIRPALWVPGTMTISLDAATPAPQSVALGNTGLISFTKVRFAATNEEMKFRSLTVVNGSAQGPNQTAQFIDSVYLFDGDHQIAGPATFDADNVARFTNFNPNSYLFNVLANQSKTITIKGSINQSGYDIYNGSPLVLGVYINEEDLIYSYNPQRFDIYFTRETAGSARVEIDGAQNTDGVTEITNGLIFNSNGSLYGDPDKPYIGGNNVMLGNPR